jgi:two-component system cell cycle sensor histidine kinase PleC
MTTDYEALFRNMQVPRFLVRARDKTHFIVDEANKLALQYFDMEEIQVKNRELSAFINADVARHFEQSFKVAYAHGKPVSIRALPVVPGVLRVHSFFIAPILDEKGEVMALDVLGQPDTSDQSVLQRERDDAVSLLSSVFDVSEIGIVVTDHKGRIVRVNESFVRIYGWTRDELINADLADLVTPDERDEIRARHEEFIRTGVQSSGEMKFIRKDGTISNVLFTTATLELSQKRRFQVTTVMDITLRKQMEQSLRLAKEQADTANRAKSTFLANMSHELRTPLNAIIGFSEMMLKHTFGPVGHDKYDEYLGDMHLSAQHLLDIINEVLDMSKIEAGKMELDEVSFDIGALIKSVIRMVASRAFGSDLKMDTNIASGLPYLTADERLIRQVLINLATNAVKFSQKGGHINISAHMLPDDRLEVIVKDDGVGIPQEKIKRALEPFGQVSDNPEDARQQGTGLGLPLAKAMVELHGGEMDLESEEGRGTSVYVRFPAERTIYEKPAIASE